MEAPTPTLSAYAARWLSDVRARVVETTWQGYEVCLRLRWLPKLGHLRLDKIRRRDVRDGLREFYAAGRKPSSCRNDLRALSALLQDALDDEMIPTNPARLAARRLLPDTRQQGGKALTVEEVRRLLAVAEQAGDHVFELLLHVLVATGLRMGEALALRWDDLDWDGGTVRVARQRLKFAGVMDRVKGKREATIEVPVTLLARLTRWHRERPGTTWLFENIGRRRSGWPYSQSWARNRRCAMYVRAGLDPRRGSHAIRHSYAVIALAHCSMEYVQRQLRHSSIAVTVDLYGRDRTHGDRAGLEAYAAHVFGDRKHVG